MDDSLSIFSFGIRSIGSAGSVGAIIIFFFFKKKGKKKAKIYTEKKKKRKILSMRSINNIGWPTLGYRIRKYTNHLSSNTLYYG